MKTLHPRLSQMFAAGLVGLTLAAPLSASAGVFDNVFVPVKGGILVQPDSPIQEVYPDEAEKAIKDKATTSLGVNFTGAAVSGLETVPGGYRIRYQNCDIYYSRRTGAHEVHGDIRAKYNHLGGPWSVIGLPATDELRTGNPDGRYNEFSGNASIYWSPNTGPMMVRGGIRGLWVGKTAENSPFGFPTSDEKTLAPGRVFSDFQNGVIFFEGNFDRSPEYAGLARAQMKKTIVNFLKKYGYRLPIDGISLTAVSDTGYGFNQSRNRLITFRIEGHIPRPWDFDPDYTLDLRLHFFAQKEADGSTTLRVALDYFNIQTSGIHVNPFHPGDFLGQIDPRTIHPDVGAVIWELRAVFGSQKPLERIPLGAVKPKLINLEVPGATPVLSFKVLPDGALGVYVDPTGFGPLARLAIQRELTDAAK